MATAALVLIGGKPAARLGDMATCTGPPDSIVVGCPTVLIGDSGGGGGAGGGTGGAAKAKAKSEAAEAEEQHYLDVKFQDKGGKPITGVKYEVKTPDGKKAAGALGGEIKKSGLQEGDCEIKLIAVVSAEWSTEKAAVGDKVTLTAKTAGIESGEEASLDIFIRDANFADHILDTLESKVDGDKIEKEWELRIDDKLISDQEGKDKQGGYSYPSFYFIAKAAGTGARSGLLQYKDYIELELKDEEGNAIAEAGYKVYLPNGKIESGKLDKNGYKKIENVPPGQVEVEFDPDAGGD
jgi:hypothetical protein